MSSKIITPNKTDVLTQMENIRDGDIFEGEYDVVDEPTPTKAPAKPKNASKVNLTDTKIKSLKPQDKPYEISDEGYKGLRLRVTAAGGKTFLSTIYVNKPGSDKKVRKVVTIGTFPPKHVTGSDVIYAGEEEDGGQKYTTLAGAHARCGKKKAQAKAGTLLTDKEKKQQEAEEKAVQEKITAVESKTVDQCLAEFITNVINQRKQPKPATKIIDGEFRGNGKKFSCDFILADLPVREITLNHIKLLVYSIKERGSIVQAKKTMDLLKQFFRWCTAMQYVDALPYNPAVNYTKLWGLESAGKNDQPLDVGANKKYLTGLPEITKLFSMLDDERDLETGNIIKILLLTGVRSRELFLAKKQDIDLDAGEWFIPKENTKTFNPKKPVSASNPDTSITIPLVPYVAELFQQLMENSPTDSVVYMDGKSTTAQSRRMEYIVASLREKHKIGSYWTPHTLRKTFRSHIKRWAAFEVAERCLNHSLGKIAGTYDLADDLESRREAMVSWTEYVYRHCYESQSNVIKLA